MPTCNLTPVMTIWGVFLLLNDTLESFNLPQLLSSQLWKLLWWSNAHTCLKEGSFPRGRVWVSAEPWGDTTFKSCSLCRIGSSGSVCFSPESGRGSIYVYGRPLPHPQSTCMCDFHQLHIDIVHLTSSEWVMLCVKQCRYTGYRFVSNTQFH